MVIGTFTVKAGCWYGGYAKFFCQADGKIRIALICNIVIGYRLKIGTMARQQFKAGLFYSTSEMIPFLLEKFRQL